jgi:hypothetical protein
MLITSISTKPIWHISKTPFALEINSKPICPPRFALIYGFSYYKLQEAVDTLHSSPTPASIIQPAHHPADHSCTEDTRKFLESFFPQHTLPTITKNKTLHFLYGYHTRHALYDHLIASNITLPSGNFFSPSLSTFDRVWHTHFPYVLLCSESICLTCDKFQIALDAAEPNSTNTLKIKQEWKQHTDHAAVQTQFSLACEKHAHLYPNSVLSIVGDYKRGDPIPTKHPTIFELSSLPRLIVHYSGFLVDNTQRPYYFLHPEHWPESGNSVVTTLHNLLTQLPNLPPALILGFDSHTTNHCSTVLAYPYFSLFSLFFFFFSFLFSFFFFFSLFIIFNNI